MPKVNVFDQDAIYDKNKVIHGFFSRNNSLKNGFFQHFLARFESFQNINNNSQNVGDLQTQTWNEFSRMSQKVLSSLSVKAKKESMLPIDKLETLLGKHIFQEKSDPLIMPKSDLNCFK